MNRLKKEYESPSAEIEEFKVKSFILTTSSLDDGDDEDEF